VTGRVSPDKRPNRTCGYWAGLVRLPDFHDRSLSRGQELSRRALEERGYKSFLIFRRVFGLSAVVPICDRTRLPFAVSDQRVVLNRRLSLCFPASLETYRRGHRELALLRPVGLTARPGRPRAEEILLIFPCYAAVRFSLSTDRNSFWRRSTATKYATSLRATAKVARLALPFCFSLS
jgi:hypothetical protein